MTTAEATAVDAAATKILQAVHERLSDKSRWTKGGNAHSEDGTWVGYESPRAVCWCLRGALWLESDIALGIRSAYLMDSAQPVLKEVFRRLGYSVDAHMGAHTLGKLATHTNDSLGYDAVMDRLRKALS
jgi:hypothetical protein